MKFKGLDWVCARVFLESLENIKKNKVWRTLRRKKFGEHNGEENNSVKRVGMLVIMTNQYRKSS